MSVISGFSGAFIPPPAPPPQPTTGTVDPVGSNGGTGTQTSTGGGSQSDTEPTQQPLADARSPGTPSAPGKTNGDARADTTSTARNAAGTEAPSTAPGAATPKPSGAFSQALFTAATSEPAAPAADDTLAPPSLRKVEQFLAKLAEVRTTTPNPATGAPERSVLV